MCNKQCSIVRKRVGEIAHSLLSEGYRIKMRVMLPTSCFFRLQHKYNGNQITIVGNYKSSTIVLRRNGKIRHQEQVC